MISSSFSRFALSAAVLVLVGAGCVRVLPVPSAKKPAAPTVTKSMGFGKLPSIGAIAIPSAAPYAPGAIDMTATDAGPGLEVKGMMGSGSSDGSVGSAGTVSSGMIARPYPYPAPQPVSVEYVLSASLPTWATDGQVAKSQSALPNPKDLTTFSSFVGLPTTLVNQAQTLNSLSVQWSDQSDGQWTFDAGNRVISYWKTVSDGGAVPSDSAFPAIDKAEAKRIADAFLDAHGFSAVRALGGSVEEGSQPYPMMGAVEVKPGMPCFNGGDPTSSIYPAPPCYWQFSRVNVVYGGKYAGRSVVDAIGSSYRETVLTVDFAVKQVESATIGLDQTYQTSLYPLIDSQSAIRRLQAGGRNPVSVWDTEGGSIVVTLSKVELVWMRYQDWQINGQQVYLIPSLLATGTIAHAKRPGTTEPYQTVLPLLKDDVFEASNPIPPTPVPMMAPSAQPYDATK